jgi:cytidylate kinase
MDTQQTLLVAIVGPAKSGKTALAQLIQDTLLAHGIECIIEDEDSTAKALIEGKVGRIVALRGSGTKVTISQVTENLEKVEAEIAKAEAATQQPAVIVHATEDGRTILESDGVKVEVQPVFSKEEANTSPTRSTPRRNDSGYVAVQVIDGVPVQAFKADEPEAAFANVPRVTQGQ